MGGYSMRMLVQGATRDKAIQAAENTIDELFSDGHLVEGDKGYVDATEYPDRESEILSAKEDPAKFIARLRELNHDRAGVVQGLFKWAHEYARKAGVERLEDLKPEETLGHDAGMAGFEMYHAGAMIAGYWTSRGIVYDADEYTTGVSEDRIQEIEKKPDEWWLVEVTVG